MGRKTKTAGKGLKIPWKIKKSTTDIHVARKMAAAAVAPGKGNIANNVPSMATRHVANVCRESTDESSLTSGISETFDRLSDGPDHSTNKIGTHRLSQYGSMDAAEDTGLSSVSSNGNIEDKPSPRSIEIRPSSFVSVEDGDKARKRLALSPTSSQHPSTDDIDEHALLNTHASFYSTESDATQGAQLCEEALPSSHKRHSAKGLKWTRLSKPRPNFRAASSIPAKLSWEEYGRQCVLAASMSRLNPYALHPGEYKYLRDRLPHRYVTTYINIRNGVLRLWIRNPMVSVTQEEAAGCAKEDRFFELAVFAYKWLVRNGYINFGCVEVPRPASSPPRGRRSNKQKTIAVVGAGMAGLGCARQLEGLIAQHQNHWINRGEYPPVVVVLEGRKRIGGRVYSHPLRSQVQDSLPGSLRNTAEMGAQIITGFEHGNPLDAIVRGQLGLHYHLMWDEIILHDTDGKAVNHERDMLVNKIHNDLLERTSDFRVKSTATETLEGLADYIDVCQEPDLDDVEGEALSEQNTTLRNAMAATGQDRTQAVPPGFAKLQGRTQVVAGNSSSRTAAQAAKAAGWELRPGISRNHSLNLNHVVKASTKPTLGATMDEAIRQYQHLVNLTPQDMRMLNWHYADLEYANAAMVHSLSLGGHDQDSGNEFEGRHSEVVGGYIQVPRGLMMLPHQLDVQFESNVKSIEYVPGGEGQATVFCTNGDMIEADKVVLTSPLGVLKARAISFSPRLPLWKQGAIDRMGFGLLNKVVLVFERPFWDDQYDMFGMLNAAEREESLNPKDYTENRGRFYLVWNCLKNSGRPMLSALMAGRAARAAEVTDTQTLVKEVMDRLSKQFAAQPVPAPVEVIVTRWRKDPFTRGTYSYVSPETQPGDYDVMAAPVGNLHFAGEATCGTHPATVHGAYLSGLRAAAEVMESLIGPIEMPDQLIGAREGPQQSFRAELIRQDTSGAIPAPMKIRLKRTMPQIAKSIKPVKMARPVKIKQEEFEPALPPSPVAHVNPYRSTNGSRSEASEEYEALIASTIMIEIGERPIKPARPGVNPFLVYTAEHWNECKETCSQEKQKRTGLVDAKATRNEVRVALGKQWRDLSEEVKSPYVEQSAAAQQIANEARTSYERNVKKWDEDASRIRMEYIKNNPRLDAD